MSEKTEHARKVTAEICEACFCFADEFDVILPLVEEALAVERECCARIVEASFIPGHSVAGPHFTAHIADKIREAEK